MYDELIKRLRTLSGTDNISEFDEAADAIEGLSHAVDQMTEWRKNRWIPVTERLPESGTRALVMRFDFVTKTPFYDLLWFDNGEWWNRHFAGDYVVTHWAPLPPPPKEE